MSTAKGRLEALARDLYSTRRDLTLAGARREVRGLSEEDREYAAAKMLQEQVNDLRRADRQKAEWAALAAESEQRKRLREEEWERRQREGEERVKAAEKQAQEELRAERDWAREQGKRIRSMNPGDSYDGDPVADMERMHRAWEGTGMAGSTAYAAEKLEALGLRARDWRDKLKMEEWTEQDRADWRAVYRGERGHPDYSEALARAPHVHWFDYEQKVSATMHQQAEKAAEQKFMKWTSELLGTAFRLADGTLTTWGEATVDQHRERASMFERQAVTGVTGAGRHLQAIHEIEECGATTLAGVVRKAGVAGPTSPEVDLLCS